MIDMPKTPYDKYKENPAWPVVEEALNELVDNQDIVFQTVPDYVIGYIVKKLEESKKRPIRKRQK
jgi:pyrrolidone-carboxylate peptidase